MFNLGTKQVSGGWGSIALLVRRFRDRFPVVSLGIFFVDPPNGTMCPEVDSSL